MKVTKLVRDGEPTAYEVLRVGLCATDEDLASAHKARAMEAHPDKGGTPEALHKVQEAWKLISTPAARKDYDDRLASCGMRACPRCAGLGYASRLMAGLVKRKRFECPACEGTGVAK